MADDAHAFDTSTPVAAATEEQTPAAPAERKSKPPRPISTIAQTFALDLDSMFGLGPENEAVDALSLTVEEKKKNVSTGQSELEALEARLRETEQRLAKVSSHRTAPPSFAPPPPPPPQHSAQQPTSASLAPPSYPAPKPPSHQHHHHPASAFPRPPRPAGPPPAAPMQAR